MVREAYYIEGGGVCEYENDEKCRGFVTADVLVKGLSRGAIATG